MNYRNVYSDKVAFSKAIAEWVRNPTKEGTKMPHALQTFALMPPLPFETNELEQIGIWMWEKFENLQPLTNVK